MPCKTVLYGLFPVLEVFFPGACNSFFCEQHKGKLESEIFEEFTVDLWTKFMDLNRWVKWKTLRLYQKPQKKSQQSVMMPFELQGNALKPIKESHWKVLVTVWPWIIMVQTTAWMTYDKLLCWRLMYYRRFEELCKSRNLVLYSCTQIPQILPLVPRNLRLYFHMPRDIPFQLWICSRLKDLMIVSTSIVSVSVCTHHIFVSLILCIWFVSSSLHDHQNLATYFHL
jgi:hypothetical protein